jgi:hypothetical protein
MYSISSACPRGAYAERKTPLNDQPAEPVPNLRHAGCWLCVGHRRPRWAYADDTGAFT